MIYEGRKATFDTVAANYDAVRPSYPEALFQAIIDLAKLSESARILEIGCGTGQATLPLARRGYSLLCLEPGQNLAALAARKLRPYPLATVLPVSFEEWGLEEKAFDLVMAAQSFHWIPAEIGYPKAAQSLKPTGSLALFWNLQPDEEPEEIKQAYRDCAPELAQEGDERLMAQVLALQEQVQAQSEWFRDVVVEEFPWSESYTTSQYLTLLNTYSDHIALPEEMKMCLHGRIGQVVEKHGGYVNKSYVAVLLVARKA